VCQAFGTHAIEVTFEREETGRRGRRGKDWVEEEVQGGDGGCGEHLGT